MFDVSKSGSDVLRKCDTLSTQRPDEGFEVGPIVAPASGRKGFAGCALPCLER